MVLEEGTFLSDSGKGLQIGKAQVSGNGWYNIEYRGTGFAQIPSHISQVQTTNGAACSVSDRQAGAQCTSRNAGSVGTSEWNTASQSAVFNQELDASPFTKTREAYCKSTVAGECSDRSQGTDAFQVSLETEGRGATQQVKRDHAPESVGWAAFARNHGTLGEVTYEAGVTTSTFNEQGQSIPFFGHFRFPPKFFASIGTFHGEHWKN
jgi:hypothetical protein